MRTALIGLLVVEGAVCIVLLYLLFLQIKWRRESGTHRKDRAGSGLRQYAVFYQMHEPRKDLGSAKEWSEDRFRDVLAYDAEDAVEKLLSIAAAKDCVVRILKAQPN